MLPLLQTVTLLGATVAAGLVAGLFYAYDCSVMPGLGPTGDATFVEAMRAINVAILDGWFALVFAGTLLLTAAAAGVHLAEGGPARLPWILAALVLSLATLAITVRIGVPLNDRLADDHPSAAVARTGFEPLWNRWNVVRTVTSTGTFAVLLIALLLR